jgi:hypothetical protein
LPMHPCSVDILRATAAAAAAAAAAVDANVMGWSL